MFVPRAYDARRFSTCRCSKERTRILNTTRRLLTLSSLPSASSMGSLLPRPLAERKLRKQDRRDGDDVPGSPRLLRTRRLSWTTLIARAWLRGRLVSSFPDESECPS